MHWTSLVWPLATFVLTAAFKARTPEQYDDMVQAGWPAWFLKLVKFVAAVGVDGAALGDALNSLTKRGNLTATQEYISKLPSDIRATLPPLAAPKRIDSKEFGAVRSVPAEPPTEPTRDIKPGDYLFNDLDLPK